jgi:hypothetical protein
LIKTPPLFPLDLIKTPPQAEKLSTGQEEASFHDGE